MATFREHVEAVYQIVRENLTFCQPTPFPGFQRVLEQVFDERMPSTERPPWLLLPVFTCEALEGDVGQAHYVAASLELGRLAAGCLDEWQDHDTHNALWRTVGAERTVSLATGMIALSFLTLNRLADQAMEVETILALQREFQLTLLHMSEGQYADLGDARSLDDYEAVAGAKSGSLFRLGCRAGAMVAGATADAVSLYGEFGFNLGTLDQVWNDLRGLAGEKRKMDARQGRALPILAGQALSQQAYEPRTAEGQAGLMYTLVQLQTRHRRVVEALDLCPAVGRLSLFLEDYSPHLLFERMGQAASAQGGYHVG
jgi:geranylgeranyl pyrophosphate synthase